LAAACANLFAHLDQPRAWHGAVVDLAHTVWLKALGKLLAVLLWITSGRDGRKREAVDRHVVWMPIATVRSKRNDNVWSHTSYLAHDFAHGLVLVGIGKVTIDIVEERDVAYAQGGSSGTQLLFPHGA